VPATGQIFQLSDHFGGFFDQATDQLGKSRRIALHTQMNTDFRKTVHSTIVGTQERTKHMVASFEQMLRVGFPLLAGYAQP
ncbi:MAG: hypothetical protein KKH22_08595, partial [Proteobacteria bacterium]|nr:hypothetical protein [Pseudomonadota bacterium]